MPNSSLGLTWVLRVCQCAAHDLDIRLAEITRPYTRKDRQDRKQRWQIHPGVGPKIRTAKL